MLTWRRIRSDLRRGIELLRKGALTTPGHIAQEMEMLKQSLELRKRDERLNELYGEVGRRVYEKLIGSGVSGSSSKSVEGKDQEVDALLREIQKELSLREKLQAQLEELRSREAGESLSEL